MADVKIEGIDKLIAKLSKLGGDSEKALSKGVEKACIRVEADAILLCPVDTGTLRRSITHVVEGDTGTVGTNVFYAPYIEFGTINQSPQAFLYPALNQNEKNIQNDIKSELERAIREVAK